MTLEALDVTLEEAVRRVLNGKGAEMVCVQVLARTAVYIWPVRQLVRQLAS